jgi:hypothetical protein
MKRGLDDYMIHEIAEMANVPEQEVLATFHATLAFMDAKARIHDFLPVLAMNQVRRQYMAVTLAKREYDTFLRSEYPRTEDKYFQSMSIMPIVHL